LLLNESPIKLKFKKILHLPFLIHYLHFLIDGISKATSPAG
jgi:hypothetical protein